MGRKVALPFTLPPCRLERQRNIVRGANPRQENLRGQGELFSTVQTIFIIEIDRHNIEVVLHSICPSPNLQDMIAWFTSDNPLPVDAARRGS